MFKRTWKWFKNIISKVLAFFGFKVFTGGNTNKPDNSITPKHGNEMAPRKVRCGGVQDRSIIRRGFENSVQKIIDGVDPENIKNCEDYFTSQNNPGWYDSTGILISLFDLILESHNNKKSPVILVQPITSKLNLSEEFKEISKLHNNRNIICIRQRPTETPGKDLEHWVVFYFVQNKSQKKLLLINSICSKPEAIAEYGLIRVILEPFLEKEKYSLHVSTTRIQLDGYSCGLIASEVARMIYLNHENVRKFNNDFVDLHDFLIEYELNGLITSCRKAGEVSYGGKKYNLKASDIRAAHYATALILGNGGFFIVSHSDRQVFFCKILQHEAINYKKARKMVKKCGFKEECNKVIREIEALRATFIGQANDKNIENFSQNINELNQAGEENNAINKRKMDEVKDIPKQLDQTCVKAIEYSKLL